jgi:hypothetical protein
LYIAYNDLAALFDKSARRCRTDTHCSAGDNRYFIFQPHLPISLLPSQTFLGHMDVVYLV